MTWRDDLPDIPGDRILRVSTAEGTRRLAARRQRRLRALGGGLAALAFSGLVVALAVSQDPDGDGDDAATEGTVPPATAASAATAAPATEAAATEAHAATEAPAATEAVEGTAAATEGTDAPSGVDTAVTPVPNGTPVLTVEPRAVHVQPDPAASDCAGQPITAVVRYSPALAAGEPLVVRWEATGGRGEVPMEVVEGVATATLGPFPPEVLGGGTSRLILVTIEGAGDGPQTLATGALFLRDCP